MNPKKRIIVGGCEPKNKNLEAEKMPLAPDAFVSLL